MSKAQILFLVVLASLPIQLGKFFFPNYSYVLGIPIDYRAQTLYFSDLIITSYILVSIWGLATAGQNQKAKFKQFLVKNNYYLYGLGAFVLYLVANSLLASISKQASMYFTLKIIGFGLLSVFAAHDFESKNLNKLIPKVITASLIWQSVVVFLQFLSQRSLGLWILGERTFSTTTPDIAHFQIFGYQLLRPYGTFSHPNVLGAFLTVYLIMLMATKPAKLTSLLAVIATLISFSKGAVFALFSAFINTSGNLRQLATRAAILILSTLVFFKLISTSQVASLAERLTLIQAAFSLALKNPLFGIGSNNFIIELAKLDLTSISQIRLLQPVHNVFLLILVENGLIGLLLFSTMLFAVAQKAHTKGKTALFISVLIFASIDHFLWTLQQGLFMFWLSLAFVISSPKQSSS
ncbi:MAG: O-antigen polymerase [Candidatus Curtissbacteria bacterium GW2011_GWA1_40_16]|uniref:O-antigen polymerase n=1 Tax=Candidatus Curtissbacteria bacterium GW2011_GWA1_40_16 TaxID=1618405 RepID=A0A0G0RER5_9BACT|nr:MAG: O-antigen polymerase [Candidatus Curtissbacteria bacterium GW2011_GWA1_40_16]